jgi:nucleotide-binding universal stress UspA family protein
MAVMRNLLVHVNDETVSRQALELAVALADAQGAAVTAVLAAQPMLPGVGLSGAEAAALAHRAEQEWRASLQAMGEALVAEVQQRSKLPIALHLAAGDPIDVLQRMALTADLLVISQRDPAHEGGLGPGQSARLLIDAACPVLTVPHIGWAHGRAAPDGVLQAAMVAWSETRESARALRDALPLLASAARVEVVAFGNDADAPARRESLEVVARYLERHGVHAEVSVLSQAEPSLGERLRRGWVPDVSVAEALLSHAAHTGADWIVMGAYGHSRLRQLVLGGVTSAMLASMTVPVLMSH